MGSYERSLGRAALNPTEIASKEFPVVMRGYLREEVQAFLAGISDQIAARDNRIAQLDAEVARLRNEVAAKPAPASGRSRFCRSSAEHPMCGTRACFASRQCSFAAMRMRILPAAGSEFGDTPWFTWGW